MHNFYKGSNFSNGQIKYQLLKANYKIYQAKKFI